MPNPDPDILKPYLEVLDQLGLQAQILAVDPLWRDRAYRPDALLRLAGAWGEATWPCEIRRRVERGTIGAVVHQLRNLQAHAGHALLLTEHVTPPLAEELRKEGLAFVDTAGNAFLREQGLYVWVTNRPRKTIEAGENRAFHAAGLKLMFVLLRKREHRRNLRDLAAEAGIALGGVAKLLTEFERRAWIRRGQVEITLEDGAAMFQRWNLGYAEALRRKLFLTACRRKPGTDLDGMPKRILAAGLADRLFVGGELGAAILTQYLRPETATLHLDGLDTAEAMQRLDLVPDRNGDVTLVTTFGRRNRDEAGRVGDGVILADPLLIHGDLLLTTADRLHETAERLRIQHIAPRWA